MPTYGTVNADVIQSGTTGLSIGPGNATRFKNRIINGDMRIDQRNSGGSVTGSTTNPYCLDRWLTLSSQNSKYTVQQNAGSITPPVGFPNYLGVTSSSAYTVLTGDFFSINQRIEGFNIADLGWGTANAKTVTLSFQVYSSLTGTFGGALLNSASNRSYPFSYTVSSANTWTSISITIAGDTSGTWLTTNGVGIQVNFSLGTGSTYSGSAGSWASANYLSATGATSVVGTNGATFYITGVQLEVASNATGFEYLEYTAQLCACYRYCYKITTSASGFTGPLVVVINVNGVYPSWIFPQTMRTYPTVTGYINNGSGATFQIGTGGMYQNANNSQDSAFGFLASAEL